MHHSEKFIVLCSVLGLATVAIAFGSNSVLANSLLASVSSFQVGAPSMQSSPPIGSDTVPVLGSTVTTPPPTTIGGESGPHDVRGAYIPSPITFVNPATQGETLQGVVHIKVYAHKQEMNSGGPTVAGMDTSYPLDAIDFSVDGKTLGKTIVGASDTEIDAALAARQAAAIANRPTTTGEVGPTDVTSDGGVFINSFYASFNRGNATDGGTCTDGTTQCAYIDWDTTKVANGRHTIDVTGTAGKWTKSAEYYEIVDNPENDITTPPPPTQNIISTSNSTVCDITAQAVIKAVGGCSKLNPNDSPNAYAACCKIVTKESILQILDSAMQDGVISTDEKSLLLNALDAYLSGGTTLTIDPTKTTTVTTPVITNNTNSGGGPAPCIKKLGVPGGGCNGGGNTGTVTTPPSTCNSNQGTISLNMNAGSSVVIGGYLLTNSGYYSFNGDYSYGCYGYNRNGDLKNCQNVTVRPCQTTNVLIRWD